MDYKEFLESKQKSHIFSGFDVDENLLNKNLFPFQKFIVKRALRAGKRAYKLIGLITTAITGLTTAGLLRI